MVSGRDVGPAVQAQRPVCRWNRLPNCDAAQELPDRRCTPPLSTVVLAKPDGIWYAFRLHYRKGFKKAGSHFFDFGGVQYQRLVPGYGSIGLFYTNIVESIQELNKQYGHDYVFPDDASGQNQYTGFGGQDDIRVSHIDDAVTLLNDIIEEGEGDKTRVWDQNGELTHYYAFDQLRKKKKYVRGKDNAPCQPSKTFNEVPIPSGVVPIPKNPSVSMYSGVAKERAMEFQQLLREDRREPARRLQRPPRAGGQRHRNDAPA